jgi:hypothetical protein
MKSFVYVLKDPKTEEIFYVGKGTGYRDKSHIKPSNWKNPKNTKNPFLYYKIKSLMEKNTPPIIERLYENLTDEQAYEIEHSLIKEHGKRFSGNKRGKLLNISDWKGGPNSGSKNPWSKKRKKDYKKICNKRRKYNPTKKELYEDYVLKNKKRQEIALENGVSDVLVKKRLQELGITKPKELVFPERNVYTCESCSKEFTTPKSVKKRHYCSDKCYQKARTRTFQCLNCGKISSCMLSNKIRKFCDRKCWYNHWTKNEQKRSD